ncbi:MAG: glycosyltransferase family 2 protein [Chloroflexi bacterium]|nr:glycosyltransferase family 2 protein [Chloroflexota bacterium]
MKDNTLLISVGLPVYNGENYVEEAIKAILAQTYANFELIISDNASTDSTQAICEAYAAQDPRIHYYRAETNKGATWNFNRVVELATGKYFKWAAHDDVVAPTFLEKCADVLEQDPSVSVCYTKVQFIDENGDLSDTYDVKLNTDSPDPRRRFRQLLMEWHLCFEIFGLLRIEQLRKTPLMGDYSHGDGVLLERLAFQGWFYEAPETLFFSRRHSEQSMNVFGVFAGENDYHRYAEWFNPSKKGTIILPTWRMLKEHFLAVWQSGLSWRNLIYCYLYLGRWVIRRRKPLLFDLRLAAKQILQAKIKN